MRQRVSKAFTLVEILIVVVILGILAAIVVPQFTSASEDAQIGNVETQLQTIRSQIELFRVKNNGQYPDFATISWGDPLGASAALRGLRGQDYLRADPVNPRNNSTAITTGNRAAAIAGPAVNGGPGWFFNDDPADAEYGFMYAAGFDEANRVWIP